MRKGQAVYHLCTMVLGLVCLNKVVQVYGLQCYCNTTRSLLCLVARGSRWLVLSVLPLLGAQ